MKKIFSAGILILSLSLSTLAQKAEVLYFKDVIPVCCMARSCDNLEATIKKIVEDNFSQDKVLFRVVRIRHEDNKDLVEQLNPRSQSVFITDLSNKNVESIDADATVRNYTRTRDLKTLESELLLMINNFLETKAEAGSP